MKNVLFFLFLLLVLVGAILSWRYDRRISEVRGLFFDGLALTDLSGFEAVPGNPRKARYTGKSDAGTPYARVLLPGLDPRGFELRLRFRARPDLLRGSSLCLAGETRPFAFSVKDDVGTFSEVILDSTPYRCGDLCIIGIYCPPCYLREGDTVELVELQFEPR